MKSPSLRALVLAAAAAALVPVATAPSPSTAAGSYCDGFHATVVGSYGVVRGTPGDDVIVAAAGATVKTGAGDDLICTEGGSVTAARGDDTVVLLSSGTERRTGELELGRGHDVLRSTSGGTVRLDLGHQRLRTDEGTFTVGNVEGFALGSSDLVDVRGSARNDVVDARGCRVQLGGGGGADRLSASRAPTCGPAGTELVAVVRGGAGDDVLLGTQGPDALTGGPGRDTVNGAAGSDRCSGEVLRHCEH